MPIHYRFALIDAIGAILCALFVVGLVELPL